VDCPNHEKHEIKCPTNKNYFTVCIIFLFSENSDCISRKAYYNLFVWLTGKLISRKAYTNLFVWLTGKYNFLLFVCYYKLF